MSHIHEEIRIEAPVDVVYRLFCDTSRYPDLLPDAIESDFSGPMDQVGTTFDYRVRLPSGYELRPQRNIVVAVEPLGVIRVADPDGGETLYRFEPDGSGTRLSVDADHQVAGVFGKIPLRAVVDGVIDRDIRLLDERLKAAAEAGVPARP
jgi:hypothetical protein